MIFKIAKNINRAKAFLNSKNRVTVAILSTALALPLAVVPQLEASARTFQVLGACDGAQAQFVGNAKKGRSQLTSFGGRTSIAGFFLDGVEGTTVGALKRVTVEYEVPADASTYEITIHVKVVGTPVSRVQNFSVDDNDPKLPNLESHPVRGDALIRKLEFTSADLLSGISRLSENNVIEKVSFFFHSTNKVKGFATKMNVDQVGYGGEVAPLLLEPVTCNLR